MSDDAAATDAAPTDEPRVDLGQRQEDRSRRFVQVCGVIFVILLGLVAYGIWSVIPDITREPAEVADAMRELAGPIAIPEGFTPLEAVEVSPLGFVSGRTAKYAGPGADRFLTASLYHGAEELPTNARIALEEETTETVPIDGSKRTVHLGDLTVPDNAPPETKAAPRLRCGWVWVQNATGVLQVSLIGPAKDFDDAEALAVLRSIDPP